MGRLGLDVANMCAMLGMKIVYYNRRPRQDVSEGYEYVDLDTLWARSDCVVLTAPLTEETSHTVNRETLRKMKDGVFLVNVGQSCGPHSKELCDSSTDTEIYYPSPRSPGPRGSLGRSS